MPNEDLIIRIKQEIENKGLTELKDMLRSTAVEMDKLVSSGQRGSQAYVELQTKAGVLTQTQRELKREFQGLGGQVKASKFQMLEFGENLTVVAAGVWAVMSRIVQLSGEMLKLGGNLLTVQSGFERLSGGADQARQNLELLRTAASGNMTDEAIMKFANRYLALGYNINQVAQILDFAERNADDFGNSMDESMQRVLRYFESGKTKGFEQLAVDAKKLEQETYRLAGGTKGLFDALDEEAKQTIRTTAFTNLYGNKLDEIRVKQKGLDDEVANTNTTYENTKARIGLLLAQGLEPALRIFDKLQNILPSITGGLVDINDSLGILISPLTSLINMTGKLWDMLIGITKKGYEFKDMLMSVVRVTSQAPGMQFFGTIANLIDWVNEKIRGMLGLLNKIPGVDINLSTGAEGGIRNGDVSLNSLASEGFREKKEKTNKTKEEVDLNKSFIDIIFAEIDAQKMKHLLTLQFLEQEKALIQEKYDIAEKEYELAKVRLEANPGDIKAQKYFKDTVQHWKEWSDAIDKINSEMKELLSIRNKFIPEIDKLFDNQNPIRQIQPYTQTSGTPAFQQKGITELFFGNRAFALLLMSQTNEIFGSIKTSLSGLMQSLNMGTDTFVGKMLTGFDRAVNYIDTIVSILQTANSISSIIGSITSIVTGGIMGGASGGGGIVGRSTNLSGMVSGMVGRGLASPAGSPNISVVVESEVEKAKAIKFFDGNLNDYYKYRRKSTFGNTR